MQRPWTYTWDILTIMFGSTDEAAAGTNKQKPAIILGEASRKPILSLSLVPIFGFPFSHLLKVRECLSRINRWSQLKETEAGLTNNSLLLSLFQATRILKQNQKQSPWVTYLFIRLLTVFSRGRRVQKLEQAFCSHWEIGVSARRGVTFISEFACCPLLAYMPRLVSTSNLFISTPHLCVWCTWEHRKECWKYSGHLIKCISLRLTRGNRLIFPAAPGSHLRLPTITESHFTFLVCETSHSPPLQRPHSSGTHLNKLMLHQGLVLLMCWAVKGGGIPTRSVGNGKYAPVVG